MKEENDIYMSIVEDIIGDLTDRRGLGESWEDIDEDIQQEIKEAWAGIIKEKIENQ